MRMKKIAIYCRQSIDKDGSASIESQEERCRSFINAKDTKEKIEVYIDRGYSGKNTNRPAFKHLLEDLENDGISMIVVYRLDRITRSVKDFCLMYDTFKAHNTQFCSITESFDTTTPTGEGMLQVSVIFAEMERKGIQQRVKDNYYDRIKRDGRWAGGPAPYGFDIARTPAKAPTLVTNENIKAVEYMFREYAKAPNTSLRKICNGLKELGYKSKRSNGGWDNVTVRRILSNSVYAVADERLQKYYSIKKISCLNEDSKWDGTTSCHVVGKANDEPKLYLTNFAGIIDSKTFIMVQERLESNVQIGRDNAPSRLEELAGKIKCKKCGYAVKSYSTSTNGMPYLSCYGNYGLKVCDEKFHGIRFWDIQKRVGEEVQKQLDEIENIILQEICRETDEKRAINEKKEQIDNLVELAMLGGSSAQIVHSKIEKLQKEIEEMELDEFMGTKITDRMRISDSIPLVYDRYSSEQKKSICQELIEKIYLSSNGDIEIVWNI